MIKAAFISNGYESLGIEFLSFALKKKGLDVGLFVDPSLFNESGFWKINSLSKIFNYERILLKEIKKYSPHIVCFSVFSDNYLWSLKWAFVLKKEIPDLKIIFGGIHPTVLPYDVVKKENVDCVICGEGEEVIYDAILNLLGVSDQIPRGVLIKKEGKIFGEAIPIINRKIDDYYPDKSIFYSKYPFYSKSYLTLTSRGCPFFCSYCANSFYHNLFKNSEYYRLRNPDNIIYELETALSAYNYDAVHFTDEVFNLKKEFLKYFISEYRKKISKPFSCYVYPDLVDEDVVKILKDGGCVKVQLGVQSYYEDKRRKVYNRFSSNFKISNAIKLFKKYDIFVVADHIVDEETDEEEIKKLIDFYDKNSFPDLAEVFFIRYYPGSKILDYAFKKGIIKKEDVVKIKEGAINGGIVNTKDEKLLRYSQYIMLSPFLKAKPVEFMLKKKLLFSSNIFLRIFLRILKPIPFDFNTGQFVSRYFFFIKKFVIR
ncbi:MAG: B12-binding domain-containing radical SAM protein [Elusimicrobiales bacterium]